jgi:hypothetical protein
LLCGSEQDKDDIFDWTRWSGSTPSQETGPIHAYDGDYYLYIEASKPRKFFDNAKLLLPKVSSDGTKCFRFFYNMNGFHVNSLELSLVASSGEETLMWKRSGNKGDSWSEGMLEVEMNA